MNDQLIRFQKTNEVMAEIIQDKVDFHNFINTDEYAFNKISQLGDYFKIGEIRFLKIAIDYCDSRYITLMVYALFNNDSFEHFCITKDKYVMGAVEIEGCADLMSYVLYRLDGVEELESAFDVYRLAKNSSEKQHDRFE